MNTRLLIRPLQMKGQSGFDFKVIDSRITVQEFLDELNFAYLHMDLPRLWPLSRTGCEGCDLCCREPLPVTSIDVLQIRRILGVDEIEVFRYLWVETQGSIVDITLRRPGGRCTFLNSQGKCDIYSQRPFACQTYLCCQTSLAFEATRAQIVNSGMDELIRCSLHRSEKTGRTFPVNRGPKTSLNSRDWAKGYYTGKNSYQQLRLARVLSFDLWHKMLLL